MKLRLEDKGQDFLTLDIDDEGVVSGYSPVFANAGVTLLGIGSLNGEDYSSRDYVLNNPNRDYSGMYIYLKDTGTKDPVPWEAHTLNYKIVKSVPSKKTPLQKARKRERQNRKKAKRL